MREGPRILVEHVLIVGNVRTSTDTIEGELQIKPGDPLSVEGRIDSQRETGNQRRSEGGKENRRPGRLCIFHKHAFHQRNRRHFGLTGRRCCSAS